MIRLEAALNQWGMEAHLAFLEVAKRDLEAARCLSSRKLYPQAVFFLQQSVEKATKSFGLWAKVVTEGEVKDAVGHDAWKVFSKIFGEFYGRLAKLVEALKALPGLKESGLMKELEVSELRRAYDKYRALVSSKASLESVAFSRKELHDVIAMIDRLRNEANGMRDRLRSVKVGPEDVEGWREEVRKSLEVLSEMRPIVDLKEAKEVLDRVFTHQVVEALLRKLSEFLPSATFSAVCLLCLSLILSPHAVSSRYPRDNSSPLEIYDERMPLVQLLDSFMRIAEEALEGLDHLYAVRPP